LFAECRRTNSSDILPPEMFSLLKMHKNPRWLGLMKELTTGFEGLLCHEKWVRREGMPLVEESSHCFSALD